MGEPEHMWRNRWAAERFEHQERALKSMLGRWVSELEPAQAFQNGRLIGLTITGLPIGSPMLLVIEIEESDYAHS